MDTNLVKCFICDVECAVQENRLGLNIARTLTMPMTSVLAKCLRTIVESENEYFCGQCVKKIEDYDQLIQLSLQIETELYELYQKKPLESCYLLDAEIIQDPMNAGLIQSHELKLENQSIIHDEPLDDELNDTYDDMVVEYLEEYETQSDDVDLKLHQQKEADNSKTENSTEIFIETTTKTEEAEIENKEEEQLKTRKKTRVKTKANTKSRIVKHQTMKTNSIEPTEQELKCQNCPYKAKSRLDLEEHKTLKHIDEVNTLICDICGRQYKTKSALCVHLGVHNGRNSHGN